MKTFILLVAVAALVGCTQSGYQKFYYPYEIEKPQHDVELLSKGEEPQVFGTDNFERDIHILRSKRFVPIGYSNFNGTYEDTKNAAAQAKRIGASVVLVHSQYTDTQTTNSALFLPSTNTTYHSGSIYGNASGTYSGTSTSYGTTVVPITSQQRRYDQTAIYFAKTNTKYRFGIQTSELTTEKKSQLGRNTGIDISVVIDDTPAFYSNVLAGDVLIAIDGENVRNIAHSLELFGSIPQSKEHVILTVIRNGEEKDIRVDF